MPKRTDIQKILLIGSGPIIIGQACEFDYSGTQACRSLRSEGYEVVLVNSNPATIMTDPMTADEVYLLELVPDSIKRVVERERPDAVLPTMGGQTGLNIADQLHQEGYWAREGIEVIGVDIEAIHITEDRQQFRDLMERIGVDQARSQVAKSLLQAKEVTQALGGLPVVIRPSFTLGGAGGGIIWSPAEFERKVTRGLEISPVHEVLIEESVFGWKEFELELLRDANDNVIIICSIENVDPMGVHTGDSVTVAPAQTLTDKQYQHMRDTAIRMMRSIGTFAGGCNVQFGVNPADGRMIAIEINPRVSRSSALASKVMAIGRTFPESLQKAWQSLEIGYAGLGADREEATRQTIRNRLRKPYWDRTLQIRNAFKLGASTEEIHDITKVDPWFLNQIRDIVVLEEELSQFGLHDLTADLLFRIKRNGFSDAQIAYLLTGELTEPDIREARLRLGVKPSFLLVDTCAGEFPAETPYYYSAYETTNESVVSDRKKVIILGSGPNRIGQGIEFDYSCVHGVYAAKDVGYEAIMVNCNPETVSTDFDVADKLYFEPVFWERVLDIIDHEKPEGLIVQLGGQTALKLAQRLVDHGIRIFGTSFEMMDLAENRGKFSKILQELEIPFPPYGTAHTVYDAVRVAEEIGYPILVRPSYVLGGQGMRIAINKEEVERYVTNILRLMPGNEILLDRFLEDSIELDVDAARDGDEVWVCGVMQHIEPAGVHSGDSTAVLPPYSLSETLVDTMRTYVTRIAHRLDVLGLINVQLVVQGDTVYVIEANPRASRTVPFVSKATGVPIARIATQLMLGEKLATFRARGELESKLEGYAIKKPVFSWDKFPEVRKELGPEMKSTGEAIAFVDALTDKHFQVPYEMRNLYLSR